MNNLLIFFAFPIAVIIISIILQKLIKNPILVSAFVFAIFLVITFAAFDENFLIATLAYTALSFITAVLTKIFCNCNGGEEENNNNCNLLNNVLNSNTNNRTERTNTRSDDNCFSYTYNRYKHF